MKQTVIFKPDGSFTLNLLTGPITVPAKRGCYVISSGCGSMKSWCSKSIILQRAHEGILYCVDKVSELFGMYHFLIQNLQNFGLTADDIVILHSDHSQGVPNDINAYQNNPASIMSKKIVLITHVRFWTDFINYFMVYDPAQSLCEPPFDGDFGSLMARSDLRKFVIFDETPSMIEPFADIPIGTFLSFIDWNSPNGNPQLYCPNHIEYLWQNFLKDTSSDPFPKQNCVMNQIKKNVIFNAIPKMFSEFKPGVKQVSISYRPIDLVQPVVNTHVLVMEGAGEFLFSGHGAYQVLRTQEKKYVSQVDFKEFPFSLSRRTDISPQAIDLFVDEVARILLANQNLPKPKRTLIATWKTYGKDSDKNNKNAKDFYSLVEARLRSKSALNHALYSVIYYGSDKSKSTNEFRD